MAPSTEAPQQYQQPSRKGKKAWRKNVDVTEIQAGLEEARDEEIKGSVLSMIDTFSYRVRSNKITVASLPKNLPIAYSLLIPKARKPSRNLTTKPTNPLKRIKF